MKETVQMHTSATDHPFEKLKGELSKHLMLDKSLFLQRLYVEKRLHFPNCTESEKCFCLRYSFIWFLIQISELNITRAGEGTI